MTRRRKKNSARATSGFDADGVLRKISRDALFKWKKQRKPLPPGTTGEELVNDVLSRLWKSYGSRSDVDLVHLAPKVVDKVLRTVIDLSWRRVEKRKLAKAAPQIARTAHASESGTIEDPDVPRFAEFVIEFLGGLPKKDAQIASACLSKRQAQLQVARDLGISRQAVARAWKRILKALHQKLRLARRLDTRLDAELKDMNL